MNVVGRVGSLISQGVYSVATPFHPFGGVVDVIVVQQQDGTFRSTPWYVRFGKFQGVLKGAEKIVRISVNGVEANFHMYLDNSGEAYFVKEVDAGKGVEANGVVKDSDTLEDTGGDSSVGDIRKDSSNDNISNIHILEHSVSDPGVVRLQDESVSMLANRIERVESDAERRFYDFQDEHSSLDGTVEFPEYGPNQFEGLDSVNGVEANFHMYLDNSGEAYFVKEVDAGKGVEANGVVKDSDTLEVTGGDSSVGDIRKDSSNDNISNIHRLEHSVSDPGVVRLQDESVSMLANRIERVESDAERRFYDFQDEHSSLDGTVEFPEYGPNQFEGLDSDSFVEPQNLDSEVILVSVDGHVLTAPISASEQDTENVQLSTTPQFHLGPGEGTEFCDEEYSSGENAWATDYISEQITSTANVASGDVCSISIDDNASGHQLEVCEGEEEHVCQSQEALNTADQGAEVHIQSDSEVVSASIKRKDIFMSCLELPELTKQVGNANLKGVVSSLDAQISQEISQQSSPIVGEDEDGAVVESRKDDGLSASCSSSSPGKETSPFVKVGVEPIDENSYSAEHECSDRKSVHFVSNGSESEDEKFTTSAAVEEIGNSPKSPAPGDEGSKSELLGCQTASSSEGIHTHSNIRFEISLCRKELCPGMGLGAAAESFDAHRISAEEFKNSAPSIIKNENLIIRVRDRYLPWETAAPLVLGMAAFGLDLPFEPRDAIPVEQDGTPQPRDDDSGHASSSGRRWRLWPIPFRRVKTIEHASSNSSTEEIFVDSESSISNLGSTMTSSDGNDSPCNPYIRTNVPTNEQIASLNLKDGQNKITFSFSTRVLGNQQVDAHIYLWKWNARIVISDVDGTITKSDVLGQFMPLVGRDWTQFGVARLFSAIKENGYQLLFLSARAIVQAYLTRSFLLNLKQDGKTLPNGPVVISPDGLFPSLYREVIRRAPHEFKIACLEDIRKLFPSDYNPFYAGFGNRDTDELSYKKMGIPKGKIFIINPKGEVATSHRIDVKSYTSLHTLVNDMFPPTSLVEQEDYNAWNYWKMPLPDIAL